MRAMLAIVAIMSVAQTSSGQTSPDRAKDSPGSASRPAPASVREAGAILTQQCVACHGPEKKKGGLDLSRRSSALAGGESGAAIVPGRAAESLLVEKVADGEMPPKGALSKEEVAAVRAWVEAGAPYPSEPLSPRKGGGDWWSLRPIRSAAPPALRGDGRPFGLGRPSMPSSSRGSRPMASGPAPEADRGQPHPPRHLRPRSACRRRPKRSTPSWRTPTPWPTRALVERLLASPHYGERWGRHWLDVVRFGESEGYETNLPRPAAWPYRDYVIRAFNRDTPFPRFVLEQLAGDTCSPPRDATG